MSKKLVHELTYDAPADQVAAMLSDPAFREEVCEAQGMSDVTVEITSAGAGKKVLIDQMQATAGVPSFAKKIVGDRTNIVQEEDWSSATSADLRVTIPGKPGDMSGTITLSESGGTTVETVDLTIKVNIPLVGGKLEGLISDLLLKALKAENRVGRAYLSR